MTSQLQHSIYICSVCNQEYNLPDVIGREVKCPAGHELKGDSILAVPPKKYPSVRPLLLRGVGYAFLYVLILSFPLALIPDEILSPTIGFDASISREIDRQQQAKRQAEVIRGIIVLTIPLILGIMVMVRAFSILQRPAPGRLVGKNLLVTGISFLLTTFLIVPLFSITAMILGQLF